MNANAATQKWITDHGETVVRAMSGGRPLTAPVSITPLRQRDDVVVFALAAGARKAVVKSFDLSRETARKACDREIIALRRLDKAGLAPGLMVYNADHGFVVSEFIEGPSLEREISPANLIERSWQLGSWLARFAEAQPKRAHATNWFDYLSLYPGLMPDDLSPEMKDYLTGLEISEFSLAKNDCHLSNFIVTKPLALIGIDFEAMRFKPVGWDVLIAARILHTAFPDPLRDFIPALCAGWTQTSKLDTPPEFERLVSFFVQVSKNVGWVGRRPDA